MKSSVSSAPYGEDVPLSLEPPLNMMSFMISVKFRLIGDAQILCFSGKFNLKSSVDRVLSTSSFLHGVIFLALEEEMKERLAEIEIPDGPWPQRSSELAPDEVFLRVNIRPSQTKLGS